jgi:hypothetical protein
MTHVSGTKRRLAYDLRLITDKLRSYSAATAS